MANKKGYASIEDLTYEDTQNILMGIALDETDKDMVQDKKDLKDHLKPFDRELLLRNDAMRHMGKIFNLFSEDEPLPSTHSVKTANELLPLIHKYTGEAVARTTSLALKMESLPQNSIEIQKLSREYDQTLEKWRQRIHQLGAHAKGLWLVDFDTGEGYLCWHYPESKVEHFHPYGSGFRNRKKIV